MKFTCNIDKTDRINRTIFGFVLCIAALLEAGKYFYIIFGLVLIVEGIVGWCSIPLVVSKLRKML